MTFRKLLIHLGVHFAVLRSFNFSGVLCCWICTIFDSAKISIIFNGAPVGNFCCSCGVHQSDPLSPLLFGLAKDYLSRLLMVLVDRGKLVPMIFPRSVTAPTYLLYANGKLLFCCGTRNNVNLLFQLSDHYGMVSGQLVNWN